MAIKEITISKSWMAQEYYNEYLSLKENILGTTAEYNYCSAHPQYIEMAERFKKELDTLTNRLRYVLSELKLCGIDMTVLVLLAAGVDVKPFG